MKPWKVFATSPTCESKLLGSHTLRGCAESDAQKFRRFLGTLYTVRVVWCQEDIETRS